MTGTVPGTLARVVGVVPDFSSYLGHVEPCELEEANVVTSTLEGDTRHAPVIDLDVPVTYVPSSTPGHGHLYVDVPMGESEMWALLEVMVFVGLVEEGYLNASKARGYTSVRLPWVTKAAAPDVPEEGAPAPVVDLAADPF